MGWSTVTPREIPANLGPAAVSRNRLLVSVALGLIVAALMVWQYRRNALVRGCIEEGGIWTGVGCRPDPGRIHIQRELQRS